MLPSLVQVGRPAGERVRRRPGDRASGVAPEGALLALQRQAGNAAVAHLIGARRRPRVVMVQRDLTGQGSGAPLKAAASRWRAAMGSQRALPVSTFVVDVLGKDLNQTLAAVAVPPVDIRLDDAGSTDKGSFRSQEWRVRVNIGEILDGKVKPTDPVSTLNLDHLALIAHTMFHEARHAEQHFLVARSKVKPGLKVDDLARQLEMKPVVAAAAIAAGRPAPSEATAEQIDAWESHGAGGRHNDYWKWNESMRRLTAQHFGAKLAKSPKTDADLDDLAQELRLSHSAISPHWVFPYNKIAILEKLQSRSSVDTKVLRQLRGIARGIDEFSLGLDKFGDAVTALRAVAQTGQSAARIDIARQQAHLRLTEVRIAQLQLQMVQAEAYERYPHEVDADRIGRAAAVAVRPSQPSPN